MSTSYFILLALVSLSLLGHALCYPAAGAYFTLSQTAAEQIATTMTKKVVLAVNSDTTAPPVNGESSKAKYTFKNWKFTIALGSSTWSPVGNNLQVHWSPFTFEIDFDFHICAKAFPNPCDSGDGKVYTTTSNPSLEINFALALDPPPHPYINSTGVTLLFGTNDIMIHVHCSDTVCLISPTDIADAIAENFVSTFESSVQKIVGIQGAKVSPLINLLPEFKVGTSEIKFDLAGSWTELPNHGFVLSSIGTWEGSQAAPFSPTIVPSTLESTPHDLDIYLPEYFFGAGLFALASDGEFNRVIQDSELPPSSPIRLTCNDSFFSEAVPGVVKYGTDKIIVRTAIVASQVSRSKIDSKGLHFPGTNFTMTFSIVDGSTELPGWTIIMGVDFDLTLTATVGSATTIVVTGAVANTNPVVYSVKSSVGDVSSDGFVQLIQIVGAALAPPPHTFKVPGHVTIQSVALAYFNQYLVLGANFQYV